MRPIYIITFAYKPKRLSFSLLSIVTQWRLKRHRLISIEERVKKRNEGVGMVADNGGDASISVGLVRILRHLGSSSRRFLQHY
ncbi:hypothetical protein Lal_00002110 [Lupinus albus]|nr:hypothetical protein Lal_00002110 [Lupinus albus]